MVWTRAGVSVLSVLVLAGPGWEQLAAQQEPAVQLQGRVIDDVTLDPVKGATVVLFDSYGVRLARRVTDEHGAFSFEVADRAAARLRAGRIGYQQVTTPDALRFADLEPDDYDVFVLKTRVHFRRGFDETGYAPTIHIVDAPGDWFGTIRLEVLEYEHVDLSEYYPFGSPEGR
jgi:microcystin degradation protein MlrC